VARSWRVKQGASNAKNRSSNSFMFIDFHLFDLRPFAFLVVFTSSFSLRSRTRFLGSFEGETGWFDCLKG
jgi:hypothetical protein